MTNGLNIDVVKRKAGCEHLVDVQDSKLDMGDGLSRVIAFHGTPPASQTFRLTDAEGDTRPWVTELIDWIKEEHDAQR